MEEEEEAHRRRGRSAAPSTRVEPLLSRALCSGGEGEARADERAGTLGFRRRFHSTNKRLRSTRSLFLDRTARGGLFFLPASTRHVGIVERPSIGQGYSHFISLNDVQVD
jgi:hypothetical protein